MASPDDVRLLRRFVRKGILLDSNLRFNHLRYLNWK